MTYLAPIPMITPVVKNNAPIFFVEKPLNISPAPSKETPIKAVLLAPIFRIILALTNARIEINAVVKLPTKLKVDGLESFSFTRAAWITPQLYVVPTNQNVITLQAPMTTQPYPPSGT